MTTPSNPHRFGDIRHVERTASTNADVLALGRDGAAEGIVVVAGTQTAGRGRHGRTWVAPPGSGLLCSILLRPTADRAGLIIPAAALAVQDAATTFGVHQLGIKWPNDVIVPAEADPRGATVERKLAGILAESEWTGAAADGPRTPRDDERVLVALGVGLNLTVCEDLPVEVAERRVALAELTDGPVDAGSALQALLAAFDHWYTRLVEDPSAVLDAWRARCVTLGRRVRVDLGAREITGRALDADAAGRLILRDEAGEDRVVAAGDVVHLRDTPSSPWAG